MVAYRLLRVSLHLLLGLWQCALVFPWLRMADKNERIKRWSSQLIAVCGVQIDIIRLANAPPEPPLFIVSNHVSWLDIFVVNAVHPCRFVAKSDVRTWPLIGWLCTKAGTIFIARGRLRDVRRIFEGLVASIRRGERVAFFPEGTTAAQGSLLPFHANLFEAAIDANVPIQPYALRYVDADGTWHPAADFVGDMGFAQSLWRICRARHLKAQLMMLPVIATVGAHRRDVAEQARCSIAAALGLTQVGDIADNRPGSRSDLPGRWPSTAHPTRSPYPSQSTEGAASNRGPTNGQIPP